MRRYTAWRLNQLHKVPFWDEELIMDTKSLDKQGKEHLQVYENFMFSAKISIIAIIALLVFMAITLI